MATQQPNNKNRLYPHLLPDDIALWERFLEAFPNQFDSYIYDVRVGIGAIPPDHIEDKYKTLCTELTQRRIDAIGYKDEKPTIIEITTSVGFKAIGQILGYPILLKQTYQLDSEPPALLVAESIQSDIDTLLIHLNIPFIIIPKPGTTQK
jgi:hypothetical protein